MADTVPDDRPLTMEERMEEVKKRAKAKPKRTYTDVPAPVKVTPGHALAHEKAAEIIRERKLAEIKKHQEQYAADALHYVECTDENCLGPAIWIWGNPNGPIPADRWEASYKPRQAGWYSQGLPHCQCCKMRSGAEVPARVWSVWRNEQMVGFTVNPRFLREADDELKAIFNTKE